MAAAHGSVGGRNGSRSAGRIESDPPQIRVGHVPQGHGHLLGPAVDADMAEELHPRRGRQVLALAFGRTLVEAKLRPKVSSSSFGPKVPAWNGPTNSQNGSKSGNRARLGS